MGNGLRLAVTLKKPHQVIHPPMVNIGVRAAQLPLFRVIREGFTHVFVQGLLQIHTLRPKRPHHHIRTHPGRIRDIAAGVFQVHVRRVIRAGHFHLFGNGVEQFRHMRGRHGFEYRW
nr:hypothetical protein [uncultured bacterium]AMP48670.1 hypothetical protein [uncultured bacterium]